MFKTAVLLCAILVITQDLQASPYWDQFKSGTNPHYATRARIGLGPSVNMGDFDKKYNTPSPAFFIDYFIYRWRSEGNSGLDIYSRIGGRILSRSDDKIESRTSITTCDIGARFLLSSFFFPKSIHYYILAAPRFLYFRDEITGDKNKLIESSDLLSIGGTGGLGIEISPFNDIGFFLEFDMSYCPVGDSNDNAGGPAAYIGITYRSRVR